MIRLNRYEGVITGGTDHKMQDAIHMYIHTFIHSYIHAYNVYGQWETHQWIRIVYRVSTHVARSRRASEDNHPSENAANPSKQTSPFSYHKCDRITHHDKGCLSQIAERG